MDATTIINLGLLLVTALGAVFTGLAALHARGSRRDAQTARNDAAKHERAALAASVDAAASAGRSASALEEANELTRSQLPTEKWELLGHGRGKWEVRNVSRDVLYSVVLNELGPGSDITEYGEPVSEQVGPGESLFFHYEKTYDSPAMTTIEVSWGDPMTGDRSNWRRTIS